MDKALGEAELEKVRRRLLLAADFDEMEAAVVEVGPVVEGSCWFRATEGLLQGFFNSTLSKSGSITQSIHEAM
jgi:hypothetical protein